MIDVSPYQLEIINNILEKHVPECEVRAFGSRVTWTAKDYSDLDLVIVGKKKLPDKTIYALEEDFQESDLPFRVDVLDWNTISPEFRKVIEKGYVVLRKGGRMGGVTGEWEEYILFDLAKWKNGLAFKNINFSEKGIPVIKISELKYGITSQTQFTEQTFDIEYFLNKGDLLLSWSGSPETSIDTFWYSLPEGWLNQHIFKITIGKAVEKIFFYYLLKYLKPTFIEIARNKQTTGLGHVTIQDLKNIKVKIPELLQQKEIVKTLFALDNKIELNNQMNKTLEAIGQTLFKRWFVDFEFPDEEGKPYKSNGGEMVDSEMGEIPKGWRVGSLSQIVNFKNGVNYSRNTIGDSEYRIVNVRDIVSSKFIIKDILDKISLDKKKVKPYLLKENSILIIRSASPGEIGFMLNDYSNVIYSGFIIKAEFYNPDLKYYLIHIFEQNKKEILNLSDGTTLKNINQNSLNNYKLVLPMDNVIKKFNQIVNPIFEQIFNNKYQTQLYSNIRDSILPRLMSGKIRVMNDAVL